MIVCNDAWKVRYSLYYDVSLNRTRSADVMFQISIMTFEMFKDPLRREGVERGD